MVTLCWAVKGGSGTTVVTALLAVESRRPSLLVDLAGEVPAVLGIPEPDRPGVVDWLAGDGPATQLDDLVVEANDTAALLPRSLATGTSTDTAANLSVVSPPRWRQLAEWLADRSRHCDVWIDAGTGCPAGTLAELVDQRWLVTRPCYLSLRRATRCAVRPTGIVLVSEYRRTLSNDDVERSLGAPIVATIAQDPAVARAVDAGLLASRAPVVVRRTLRRLAA